MIIPLLLLSGFTLILLIPAYLGWRNFEVHDACQYLSHLVYLNNIKNIYSNIPIRYDVYNFPSYNKLLLHVKPILSLIKFPDGFETEFSIELLDLIPDKTFGLSLIDSLALIKVYQDTHKVKKNV